MPLPQQNLHLITRLLQTSSPLSIVIILLDLLSRWNNNQRNSCPLHNRVRQSRMVSRLSHWVSNMRHPTKHLYLGICAAVNRINLWVGILKRWIDRLMLWTTQIINQTRQIRLLFILFSPPTIRTLMSHKPPSTLFNHKLSSNRRWLFSHTILLYHNHNLPLTGYDLPYPLSQLNPSFLAALLQTRCFLIHSSSHPTTKIQPLLLMPLSRRPLAIQSHLTKLNRQPLLLALFSHLLTQCIPCLSQLRLHRILLHKLLTHPHSILILPLRSVSQ